MRCEYRSVCATAGITTTQAEDLITRSGVKAPAVKFPDF